MSNTGKDSSSENLFSLVDQMRTTITHIDHDDLGALAKMHGWCNSISGECEREASPSYKTMNDTVNNLAEQLEELILGDAPDANETFQQVNQGIQSLVDLAVSASGGASGETPAASPATEEPPADIENLDAAEQLAKVFDDAPATGSAPEAPAAEAATEASAVSEPAAEPETPANDAPSYVPEPLLIDESELDFVKGFVEEAYEHIQGIENALLEVESNPGDVQKIDDLFRPFHTIKGMAGFLNLRDINSLTHEAETLLDQCRKGKRPFDPDRIYRRRG